MCVFFRFCLCCTGTQFMVDGFAFTNPKCSTYFLTHYHSDHTVGLIRRFTAGTIYCSPVTCVLVGPSGGLAGCGFAWKHLKRQLAHTFSTSM
jgi:ribonuclease BN (tRNA processing enzyme)